MIFRAWWTPAPRCVRWRFPVQEPLIRAEVEEDELWGAEDRFGHARITYLFDMSAILVQFHTILGERHGLVFQFERPLIDPHVHRLIRQSSLTTQPPILKDEANRLKDAGLEVIRDIADRGKFGLVLLGMPGLDKRLARAPQLYSRIGFAQKIEPLSDDETRFFLDQRWSHRVSAHSDDFTDQEAVAAILRITRGNIRLIERLMMQVEHILVAN